MSPELGQAGFRIACLLILPSAVMLFFLDPGTAEYSITLLTLLMGLVFLAAVLLVVRRSQR